MERMRRRMVCLKVCRDLIAAAGEQNLKADRKELLTKVLNALAKLLAMAPQTRGPCRLSSALIKFFSTASDTLPGKGAEGASETPRYGAADPGAVSTFVGIRPGSNPRQPLLRDGDLIPFSMDYSS